MMDSIDVVYLLCSVAGVFALISWLRYTQKAVLKELQDVLQRQGNPILYLEMLKSKKLTLVFRKGTLLLLELEACLRIGNDVKIRDVFRRAETVYMNKGEKLDFYRKKFSYLINAGQFEQARETYGSLELLLSKETDEKLKAILKDARLILGIYADRDVTIITQLVSLEREQNGSMQGITRFRLAKLYWFANEKDKAMKYLALAEPNLRGTVWEPVIKEVCGKPELLETR